MPPVQFHPTTLLVCPTCKREITGDQPGLPANAEATKIAGSRAAFDQYPCFGCVEDGVLNHWSEAG